MSASKNLCFLSRVNVDIVEKIGSKKGSEITLRALVVKSFGYLVSSGICEVALST